MKPWQKTSYYKKETEDTTKATASVEVSTPPVEEKEVIYEQPELEEYKCPVCGKVFTSKVGLANHLRAHERRGEYEQD